LAAYTGAPARANVNAAAACLRARVLFIEVSGFLLRNGRHPTRLAGAPEGADIAAGAWPFPKTSAHFRRPS
jgi:hypothetical protein